MKRITHYLAISILILGLVSVAIGIAFVVQGRSRRTSLRRQCSWNRLLWGWVTNSRQRVSWLILQMKLRRLVIQLEGIVVELLRRMTNCWVRGVLTPQTQSI